MKKNKKEVENMKSKYRFRRLLSGVMAAVTILSTVISPLTVYASEEPKTAEPPAYESVKDLLDEEEVVKATDLELEAGQEYTIQTASRMEKIPFKDIFYVQRDGKNAMIVSSAGTAKVRKSLQQVFDELNTPEFIFIDRGCIVNIIHIMKISDGMAVLKNGEQLPISRSHLQEVKQKINEFWGAHI